MLILLINYMDSFESEANKIYKIMHIKHCVDMKGSFRQDMLDLTPLVHIELQQSFLIRIQLIQTHIL
jgi:hypothetical protein